ncbi:MAG: UDP-2,3-diacylglucosamine diphosphatase [Planctomycetes bacterium]|nr:UDP-2,3-diacylglucosamine diphosphatase [Planctomycetota bacterium]
MGALPQIELHEGARVIADLHLDLGDAQSVEPFLAFLAGLRDCPELVVLGDLFDVWVGPAQMSEGQAPRVLGALAHLEKQGTKLFIVHGNRDFLLEQRFAERVWGSVQPEGFVAKLPDGTRMLCVHGDTLCTKDTGYQRLRRVLRSPPMLWIAPRLPYWFARALARRLRRASVRAIAAKLPDEKSIQRDAVEAAAREHHASIVLCGHAHEFRDERVGDTRWLVLDAFGGSRGELLVASGGLACG